MSFPHTLTFPSVFFTNPAIILIKVDLPAPLAPSKPNIDCLGIFKFMPFKASNALAFLKL